MKKIFLLLVVLLMYSCSDIKEDAYQEAIKDLKTHLKVPSTAIFESYNEKYVNYSTVKDNGEDRMIDIFDITLYYESQNSFGTMLKGKAKYRFKRKHYSDGTFSELEIIEKNLD